IYEEFKQHHPKKTMGQGKIFNVTQRFWYQLLAVSGINPEKQVAQISQKEMRSLLDQLRRKTLKVEGKSTFKDEFVTAGGVELKESNLKTVSSNALENFYIAGEVLDIDAVTGGFNFEACWSEAWLIAEDLNGK